MTQSEQEKYITDKGWQYVGTQDNLVMYFKDGKLETMRLSDIPQPCGCKKS